MDNAMPVADEVKALVKRLRAGGSDPMWDAHCEMDKRTINQAADLIERLARAEPAVPVDQELVNRVQYIMDAPAVDRWKVANLTNHDWRRILSTLKSAHPPRTPDVEVVAEALCDDAELVWEKLPDHHDMVCGHSMPEGCKDYWRSLARAAIAAMTGEAGHG